MFCEGQGKLNIDGEEFENVGSVVYEPFGRCDYGCFLVYDTEGNLLSDPDDTNIKKFMIFEKNEKGTDVANNIIPVLKWAFNLKE